jgi:hypothetical protein
MTAQEAFTLPPITRRKGRNRTVVLAHPFFWRLPVDQAAGFLLIIERTRLFLNSSSTTFGFTSWR